MPISDLIKAEQDAAYYRAGGGQEPLTMKIMKIINAVGEAGLTYSKLQDLATERKLKEAQTAKTLRESTPFLTSTGQPITSPMQTEEALQKSFAQKTVNPQEYLNQLGETIKTETQKASPVFTPEEFQKTSSGQFASQRMAAQQTAVGNMELTALKALVSDIEKISPFAKTQDQTDLENLARIELAKRAGLPKQKPQEPKSNAVQELEGLRNRANPMEKNFIDSLTGTTEQKIAEIKRRMKK